MADLLKVFVRGEPEPQPSLNARIAGKFPKQFVHFYEANKYPRGHAKAGQTMPWFLWRENVIRTVESVHRPTKVTGPIRLDLDVYYPRPQYLLKKSSPQGRIFHTVKDDCDNLQKLIQDALTHVGVWADDAQICQWGGDKWWVKRGDPCGVWIHVQTLRDDAPVLFEDDAPKSATHFLDLAATLFKENPPRPTGRPKATPEPPEKEVPQRPRPPGWVAPTPMVVPALD